jgi:hypothetical protein
MATRMARLPKPNLSPPQESTRQGWPSSARAAQYTHQRQSCSFTRGASPQDDQHEIRRTGSGYSKLDAGG